MNGLDIKFEDIAIEQKIALVDILGYKVDEAGLILDKETEKEYECPLTGGPVFVENASILPGSTIIINTTELSLSEYFTQFVDKLAQ